MRIRMPSRTLPWQLRRQATWNLANKSWSRSVWVGLLCPGPWCECLGIKCRSHWRPEGAPVRGAPVRGVQEMDLTAAQLGDLRLCALLAADVLEQCDSHTISFLRTMCKDVLLDDPRGAPPSWSKYSDFLTNGEHDLSQVLESFELPHCRGTIVNGAFFPLTSDAMKAVICLETFDAGAAYVKGEGRCTWQCWKYRVATAAGWRVYAIGPQEWKTIQKSEEKVSFVRELLQRPPLDVASL
ncbi:Hypothetical protein SCF082_LOCUS50364 [Durusdinium trenchii]|uniref:SnoaL-like domain-containing protein n=1 Tax=Durusdinium trenchii TaxID=1381693 RepID=A0ABP0S7G2_9DINO